MSADTLLEPIRAHIAELGFELVDLRRTGTLNRPIFQVRVDRPESRPGHGVTVEDCARISRSLERFLEARGTAGIRYVLEVSSPGIGFRRRKAGDQGLGGRGPEGSGPDSGASDIGESDGRID
jgi:ribosome maturation factor RimP